MSRPPVARRAADQGWHPAWLLIMASLWMATAGNLALWQALHRLQLLEGWRGLRFGLGFFLGITALMVMLLAALGWRRTLKPALIALMMVAAASSHFMLSYGVVVDSAMVTNVLQSDLREACDLLSPRLAVTLLLLAGVPALVVWRLPLAWPRWPHQLRTNLLLVATGAAVLAAVLLTLFQPLAATMRNHHALRYQINPLNALYALGRLTVPTAQAATRPRLPLGRDARISAAAASHPPLLLLVLGETARSDHFSLNGYPLPTTPQLAALPVQSQRQAWSCGTSTAASVPCLFSHLGREAFVARSDEHDNLLDVLQQAGLAVLWLDNQGGCKGVCDRVPHASTTALKHAELCPGGECADEIMLEGLDARIAALPAERRQRGVVLVLHQMGSHGPAYHLRSPPALKHFGPECQTAALQDCSREQVVAAYDNSIRATDQLLARAIGWLQQRSADRDTALLYVSDHGESLGENNLYLHGLPYALAPDTQKHVPWISWFSAGWRQRQGLDEHCLGQRLDEPLSHDHYFHSVLGLLNVQTEAYRPERDFYRPCRQP